MAKIALITGITGQDGSYLAELLLKKKVQSTWNCKTNGFRVRNPQTLEIKKYY